MKTLFAQLVRWLCQLLTLASCSLATAAFSQTDTNATSAILGFQRLQLSEGWHLIGVPLEPFAAARGTVNQIQNNQLFVAGDLVVLSWEIDQWKNYEMRMATGTARGRRYAVTESGSDWLQVDADLTTEGVIAGDVYELLPTLEDFLGTQLVGAGAASQADWVATYENNDLVRLHRNATGQWRDVLDRRVWLSVVCGEGFWLNLITSDLKPRTLVLVGRFNADGGGVFIAGGQQVISLPFSDPARTLGSIPWTAQGAVGAANPDLSDRFSVWEEDTGEIRTCWLDSTTGKWRWQDTGEEASDTTLEGGRGYLYQHVGQGFYLRWR